MDESERQRLEDQLRAFGIDAPGCTFTQASDATRADSPPLTIGRLLEIAAAIPRPEIVRIIVGGPGLPRDKALKWTTKRILWLHHDIWFAIPKTTTDTGPEPFGIAVEFFDWDRHSELWRDFMGEYARTLSLSGELMSVTPPAPSSD